MLKVFIIEDEQHILGELKLLLEKRKDVVIVGSCTSVFQALQILPNIEIDLALMDIQLDDGKSFEIIEKLEEINFNIVFITAYNEYAIRAIKIGAMDYLLKPINEDELYSVIDTCKSKIKLPLTDEQRQITLQNIDNKRNISKIVVRTLNEIFFIEINDIHFCKGEGNYTTFYCENDKTIISSKPLREYVSILPKDKFIKTHQSYLINKDFVDHYKHSHEIVMRNKEIIPVSVRHKENVIKKLTE